MAGFSRNEVILVRYPFSDLTTVKVRPAVVVGMAHVYQDNLIVPLTSRVSPLLPGELVLADWAAAGLNTASAVKRGIYTVYSNLVIRSVGRLSPRDAKQLDQSLREWLSLS